MVVVSPDFCKTPLVSVIVFTYNQESYIQECINGILDQKTDFEFEIIIGEDCSTDKTRSICQKLQRQHSDKIKLLLQDTNQGLTKNYISTLEQCRGKYIAQTAGDDYWNNPDKLQKQVEILNNNPEIGLIYTDVDFYHQATGKFQHSYFKDRLEKIPKNFEEHLVAKAFLAPLTWLYRSEHSPVTFKYTANYADESFAFLLDIFKKTNVFYLDEVTAVRRVVKNSLSHQTEKQKIHRYNKGVFDIQKEYIQKYQVDADVAKTVYSSNYISQLGLAIELNDEEFIQDCQQYCAQNSIDYAALETLCKENLRLQKLNSNKVNQTYLKIRKYF